MRLTFLFALGPVRSQSYHTFRLFQIDDKVGVTGYQEIPQKTMISRDSQSKAHSVGASSSSVTSRLSHKSADWDRSRATGSAAVDLTNLFLNPHKPSAINVWQVMCMSLCSRVRPGTQTLCLPRLLLTCE